MEPEPTFDEQLLDLHLGRLSPSEQVELNLRIATDPALARQNEALAGVFHALNEHKADPAPPDLATRIVARVAAAGAPLHVIGTRDLRRHVERETPLIFRIGSMREIVAAAAMIVLMIGFAVPSVLHMRERGQRMGCSANLAALGLGLQQYAATYNSSLPFAGWNSRASWAPSQDPGVVVVPNRQHVYPLLRQAFILKPRVFLCPARGGAPMPPDQVARRNDFMDADNLSYTYFNMAGQRPSPQDNPDVPVMSDENPIFGDGVPLISKLVCRDRAKLNSPAHSGAGQNILIVDGHVKWVTAPDAGVDGDNIWTLQGVNAYTGREGPAAATDAQLIK